MTSNRTYPQAPGSAWADIAAMEGLRQQRMRQTDETGPEWVVETTGTPQWNPAKFPDPLTRARVWAAAADNWSKRLGTEILDDNFVTPSEVPGLLTRAAAAVTALVALEGVGLGTDTVIAYARSLLAYEAAMAAVQVWHAVRNSYGGNTPSADEIATTIRAATSAPAP